MNWNAFIAGWCMISILKNIEYTFSYFNHKDNNMEIYNIASFIVIMVISIAQIIIV